MKKLNDSIRKAQSIIKDAENRRKKLEEEKSELEERSKKGYQEAQIYIANDKTDEFHACLDSVAENNAKISFVESELEKPLFSETEIAELKTLKAQIKKCVDEKNEAVGDVYYNALQNGRHAEKLAQSAKIKAQGTLYRICDIIGEPPVTLYKCPYAGMIEVTRNQLDFIGAWQGFKRRASKK